jgi:hypothetical protein
VKPVYVRRYAIKIREKGGSVNASSTERDFDRQARVRGYDPLLQLKRLPWSIRRLMNREKSSLNCDSRSEMRRVEREYIVVCEPFVPA